MNTYTTTYNGQEITVTVAPYNKEYEREVRKSLDHGTNREGQTFSTYTNVDGHYGRSI